MVLVLRALASGAAVEDPGLPQDWRLLNEFPLQPLAPGRSKTSCVQPVSVSTGRGGAGNSMSLPAAIVDAVSR